MIYERFHMILRKNGEESYSADFDHYPTNEEIERALILTGAISLRIEKEFSLKPLQTKDMTAFFQ